MHPLLLRPIFTVKLRSHFEALTLELNKKMGLLQDDGLSWSIYSVST